MKFFSHLSNKDNLSIIAYINHGFAGPVATILHKLHVTANQVTIFRAFLLFYAIYCFFSGEYSLYIQGSIILLVNSFLDCVDGDLARLSKNETQIGEWLETITGNPLASIHGLAGFSMAWGIYKQTGRIEVWFVLFFISYGLIMNDVLSRFSFHTTETLSEMKKGFQKEYDTIMKFSLAKRIYFTFIQIDGLIIIICLLLNNPIQNRIGINSLFMALILICAIYQFRWLLRLFLQSKYLLTASFQPKADPQKGRGKQPQAEK